jgi:hypothetical protein
MDFDPPRAVIKKRTSIVKTNLPILREASLPLQAHFRHHPALREACLFLSNVLKTNMLRMFFRGRIGLCRNGLRRRISPLWQSDEAL